MVYGGAEYITASTTPAWRHGMKARIGTQC
jgi:hypothetical protein